MPASKRRSIGRFLLCLSFLSGLCSASLLPGAAEVRPSGLAHWEMDRRTSGAEVLLRWEYDVVPKAQAKTGDAWVLRQGDLPLGGAPGEPLLPFQRVRILAPPEADLAQARVEIANAQWVEWSESVRIAPAPPFALQSVGPSQLDWAGKDPAQIKDGRDQTIYASDEGWPRSTVEIAQVGQCREWKLVDLIIHPLRYRPLSGQVGWLAAGEIRLQLPAGAVPAAKTAIARPGNAGKLAELMKGVLNGAEHNPLYAGLSQPSAVCDIVLVTTQACWQASALLQSWVGQRRAINYKVHVVTEGPTEDDNHYASGTDTDSRADNIRAWLKARYFDWGFSIALLVGDPVSADASAFKSDLSVPMKICYPNGCSGGGVPTDMYFCELSGDSWDRNQNDVDGEWPKDFGPNGVDHFSELYIGRVPIYKTEEIDNIFGFILKYGAVNPLPPSRKRVVIGGAVSNFAPQDSDGDGVLTGPYDYSSSSSRTFGADWGEAIRSRAVERGDSPYTLYEKEGVYTDGSSYPLTACDNALTEDNLAAQYPKGAGYLALWGHGSSSGIFRTRWMNDPSNVNVADSLSEVSQVRMLSSFHLNPIPEGEAPFVALVACSNSMPEVSYNLGRQLLFLGAPGVWGATRMSGYHVGAWTTQQRESWADNASFGYWIYDYLRYGDAGYALHRCYEDFAVSDLSSWFNMVMFTLYGDPTLGLDAAGYPYVEMQQPANLSEWPVGSTMDIQWTTRNWPGPYVDGPVRIDLTRDRGLTWETIIPDTPNNGHAQWTVAAPGNGNCRLRLTAVNKPGCALASWNDFAIQELTVTAPVAYEKWLVGSAQKIQWEAIGIGGQARVELNRNYPSGNWEILHSYAQMAQGAISWTVTGPGSSLCRVRVTSLKNPAILAYSNIFNISQLVLTAPTGGETWRLQEMHYITWNAAGMEGNVRIRLQRDTFNNSSWETIADNYPNLGSYPWAVTGPVSRRARIWIYSVNNPDLCSSSAADFNIGGITFLSPGAGENWVVDGLHTLIWSAVGVTGNVKIELCRAYPYGTWETLFDNVPEDGGEPWQTTGPAAANCRLRITSVDDPTLQGVSAADFHIHAAPLKLNQPNGGERWPVGTTKTIAWSSTSALSGNVGILINRNYPAEAWSILFPNLTNDGSEPWLVTGPVSSKCRLKIYSLANPSAYVDLSNADFTICNHLDLQAPDGGEQWVVGSTGHIAWQAAEIAGNLRIELNRAFPSGPWETLFNNVPVTALGQDWTITGPASASCVIRLVNEGDLATVTDQSTEVFRLVDSVALSIQEPHAGAYWVLGKPQSVTWTSVGAVGDVQVELQREAGAAWELLSPGAADSGSRTVTITGAAAPQARIRVSSATNPAVASTSPPFSLITTASLTLRSPIGGEKWAAGQNREITWASNGLNGNVRVELNRNYPAGVWETLLEQDAVDGRAVWPVTGPASATCRVRLSDALDPTVQSCSLANFQISGPVSLQIRAATPLLVFRGILGDALPLAQTILLTQDGGDQLDWSVTADAAWLSANPNGGVIRSTPQALVVQTLAETGRSWPGIRKAGVTVAAPEAANSPLTIPVKWVLTPSGDVNQDGRVNALDLTVANLVANGILRPVEDPCPNPEQGDFDASGGLGLPDVDLFSRYLSGEGQSIFRPWDLPDPIY